MFAYVCVFDYHHIGLVFRQSVRNKKKKKKKNYTSYYIDADKKIRH